MADCCKLVGNLLVSGDTVFSIQVNSSTEVQELNGVLIVGPTIGNLNVSAYAALEPHIGCPGNASVTLNWLYKYDCDNDVMYILYDKGGKGSISGDVGGLATIGRSANAYNILNASTSAGPSSIYEDSEQIDGFGFSYSGLPWSFDTEVDVPEAINISAGSASFTAYIRTFSLQCVPGSLPVATYGLLFTPMDCVVG